MSIRIRASVIGATGYTGAVLCSLLERHSGVELIGRYTSSRTDAAAVLPPGVDRLDVERLVDARPGCVFLATPNEASADLAPRLISAGVRVIDLSGAFRLKQAEAYPRWYGFAHPAPALLQESVYGLTEWCDIGLDAARLVANPGCYATSALLALLPVMPLIDVTQTFVCDGKSGVSGAGKRSDPAYSFAEMSGNVWAYAAAGHRHEPEIRQAAGLSDDTPFVFVPHLLPIVRGILSTLYLTFLAPVTVRDIASPYHRAYGTSPFVRVLPEGSQPGIGSVVGTPRCEIGFALREGGRHAVVVSVLDNLLKGAASQAVQNLNRMFGFDEEDGLR